MSCHTCEGWGYAKHKGDLLRCWSCSDGVPPAGIRVPRLPTGEDLRDDGMAMVEEHSDPFPKRVRSFARSFFRVGEIVTGESIRKACEEVAIHPHHPNAWGAVVNSLRRDGFIEPTGEYAKPTDPTSHARAIQVYRVAETT